jgi:RNA polymerase sigma factor (sigma-70 family)
MTGFPDDATLARVRTNVHKLVARRLPPGVDPSDVTADVLLCFAHYRGDSSPNTFAHRIARNMVATHWRAWRVRSCVESSDAIDDFADVDEREPWREALEHVRSEAERLPEHLRDVVGSWLAGMRPREIGHALGLNEHTVRSRLVRGRAALRERVVLH